VGDSWDSTLERILPQMTKSGSNSTALTNIVKPENFLSQ